MLNKKKIIVKKENYYDIYINKIYELKKQNTQQ